MVSWFNAKKSQENIGRNDWLVQVNEYYWLGHPEHFRALDRWLEWGKMQARIISLICNKFPSCDIYWRFHTYLPDKYTETLDHCEYRVIQKDNKKGNVYITRNCWNQGVWVSLFSSLGIMPLSRCIFLLDYSPNDWIDNVNQLFSIAKEIEKGKPLKEYENELSSCKCLCYSEDEDLVIAKVDLDQHEVISIIQDVAKESSLQLVLKNESIY